MAEPTYDVGQVWSWRKFRKVFRFSYWDTDINKFVVFFAEFTYNKGKELRYRFWLPWKTEAASKPLYMQNATYQLVLRHFLAESLQQFVKENPNGE